MKALDAQVADRKDDRVHTCRMRDRILIFASVLTMAFLVLLAYCLQSGHELFASEILKLVGYVGVGVFGGYGIGRKSGNSTQSDDARDSGS